MSKDILIELLKKSLEDKLKYIENRSDEHIVILQHTKCEFDKFTSVIDNMVRLRKEREVIELQESEKKEKEKEKEKGGDKADKSTKDEKAKKEEKKKPEKPNTKPNTATSTKKTMKPAQSSANITTQKATKGGKGNLTIETNVKGKRTQTPGGGKRTKTEPSNTNNNSNTSRNTMPVSSARGSVQGNKTTGGKRSNSKPSTKKSGLSKGKGDKASVNKTATATATAVSSASSKTNKVDKTLTKIQPIIETKEETAMEMKQQEQQQQQVVNKETKPKTLIEKIQEKLIISEYIFPYLTEEERMQLMFTNKHLFIKNLQEVFKLKKESKLKSLNVLIGQTIDDKIEELKNSFPEEELSKDIPEFSCSQPTIKALELLNQNMYTRIFRFKTTNIRNFNQILIVYKVFCQLLNKTELLSIPNEQDYWKEFSSFVNNSSYDKMSDFFEDCSKRFDLSEANMWKIKKLIGTNIDNMNPQTYSSLDATTGVIAFILKDVFEYTGILDDKKKTHPMRIVSNLTYQKELITHLDKFIASLEAMIPY